MALGPCSGLRWGCGPRTAPGNGTGGITAKGTARIALSFYPLAKTWIHSQALTKLLPTIKVWSQQMIHHELMARVRVIA